MDTPALTVVMRDYDYLAALYGRDVIPDGIQLTIYPAHHTIGLRRGVFERTPQVAVSLYRALDQARVLWQQRRLFMAELTPWILADIEETASLMGADWQPNGVSPNRKVIAALCDEEHAQGLIARPLDPATVFADFDAVMKT